MASSFGHGDKKNTIWTIRGRHGGMADTSVFERTKPLYQRINRRHKNPVPIEKTHWVKCYVGVDTLHCKSKASYIYARNLLGGHNECSKTFLSR
jgi:hypothetical protein